MDVIVEMIGDLKSELVGFVVGGANNIPSEMFVPNEDSELDSFVGAMGKFLELLHIEHAQVAIDDVDEYHRMIITGDNGFVAMSKYMSKNALQLGIMCWLAVLSVEKLGEIFIMFHATIANTLGLARANEELISVMLESINGISVVIQERIGV